MTEETLVNRLARLDAAATSGPWGLVEGPDESEPIKVGDHVVAFTGFDRESPRASADAELIVELRNAVPEILAALAQNVDLALDYHCDMRAVEAERDQLRAAVARVEAVAEGTIDV